MGGLLAWFVGAGAAVGFGVGLGGGFGGSVCFTVVNDCWYWILEHSDRLRTSGEGIFKTSISYDMKVSLTVFCRCQGF